MNSASTLFDDDEHPPLGLLAASGRAGRVPGDLAGRGRNMEQGTGPTLLSPNGCISMYAQSHGAADYRASGPFSSSVPAPPPTPHCFVADGDECRPRFACEAREAYRHAAREDRGRVDHDEVEGATAQQDVRAPAGARGILRSDHPQSLFGPQVCPITGRQRARGVDVRHPSCPRERFLHHPPEQRRRSAPMRAHDLRQPPPRHSSPWQCVVERLHTRWQGESLGARDGAGRGRKGKKIEE